MDFARIDLNLLVVFDTLMRERHVTRAASSIGLTQSATSSALGRLRQLFQDDLFVRSTQGMLPTPRAEELAPDIAEILTRLRALDAGEARFDPAALEMRVTIGMSDYVSLLLAPPLLALLERQAPGVRLRIEPVSARSLLSQIDSGHCDLAIDFCPEVPGWAQHKPLFFDDYVCMVSQGGRYADVDLTLPVYAAAHHCQVTIGHSKPSEIDERLADLGLHRDIAARVPSFLLAPFIVTQSDLVSTLPRMLAQRFADLLPVVLKPLPLQASQFGPDLIWHRRTDKDPAHLWLRRQIARVAADQTAADSAGPVR
ncbi:LysR family transcriptional regulator [Mameliella alba]|nr:LysR family transcriptional regulator [Mameliella alba]MBY6171791.1 LysR family transcriptional regulator [Mameliella alba]MBY6177016.1 LysR family transcriptional regulator [Mameliella alba]